jgi:hypothetical protein
MVECVGDTESVNKWFYTAVHVEEVNLLQSF